MSNVIGFLETLGSRPALSPADYANAVALLDADQAQREALLDRDQATLNQLLDGRHRMVFAICTPDDDQESVPDKHDDDVPEQDEPEPEQK